jgi:glycosyltransferase involved in cell wall biosynthesis
MTGMNACTIVGRRSLARARVMAATLQRQHPGASLTVLLLDGEPEDIDPIPGARILGARTVVGEDFALLAAANATHALEAAVLPRLVGRILDEGAASVVFVAAGQRLTGSMQALLDLLGANEVLLVSGVHRPDAGEVFGKSPHSGVVKDGIVGFAAGPRCEELLAVWPHYFAGAGDEGATAARRWLDSVLAAGPGVGVLRDEGFAIDFADLDPREPLRWLADASAVESPELRQLAEAHSEELLAAGGDKDRAYPRPYAELEDGLRLTDTIRALLVEAINDGSVTDSPFAGDGREAFYRYLNAPGRLGTAAGLTRLHVAIWNAREDLRVAYPQIEGPDGLGFAGWLCAHGEREEGLVAELLPPAPELSYRDADPQVHDSPPLWGVNVAGFFTAELGMGEAARLLVTGLDAARIPALPIQGHLMPPSERGVDFTYLTPDEAAYPLNIVCINGDGIAPFAREAGRSFFAGRYSIGLWWWEAGEPPESWSTAYDFLDEVWVCSQYVYDAIAPSSPVPVVRVRLPLLEPQLEARSRADLGFPPDGFLFLCVHDYQSIAARKNPVGAIEAFRRAFPEEGTARLVVKSLNAAERKLEHARVIRATGERNDITLLDGYVSSTEKNAMIAACDCMVSLHRSEGFGIPLAEAMMLEKPVIATRYGGSLEFMNDENSYLVDWSPVPVGPGSYPYSPDAVWANPDLDDAASLMRRVLDAPDEASVRAAAARTQLLARHAPAVCGEILRDRLALLHRRLYQDGARTLNLAHVPTLAGTDGTSAGVGDVPILEVGTGRLAGLRSRAFRPFSRWARDYAQYNAAVAEQTRSELGQVDQRVREVAATLLQQQTAQHAETLAALRRMERSLGSGAQAPKR